MDAFLERALTALDDPAPAPRLLDIQTRDGFFLSASEYSPTGPLDRRRTVVINSATAVRRTYYSAFAAFLARRGFRVITYDYRGIGGSRPADLRGFRAHMRDWGELDFAAVVDFATGGGDDPRPIVIGHSVGGQIVGLAANNERVGALMLVGAQCGHATHFAPRERLQVLALWYGLIPSLTLTFGYLPGFTLGGEDLPAGVAREWARWGRRRGYLVGGPDGERAAGFARLHVPILAYSFTDDPYAPEAAVVSLLDLYEKASITRRHLEPASVAAKSIGHFGFFRPAHRSTLWAEAARWLDAPSTPRGGGPS